MHIAIALLMLLVVFYLVVSIIVTITRHTWGLVVYGAKNRKRVSVRSVGLVCVALFTTTFLLKSTIVAESILYLLSGIVNACEPVLLRVFGVGGQGFLQLFSFYFVDVEKLSGEQILWRIAAGSYTTILVAIFMAPMLLVMTVYLSPVDDAVKEASERSAGLVPNVQQKQQQPLSPEQKQQQTKDNKISSNSIGSTDNDRPVSVASKWECKICLFMNPSKTKVCGLCEGHRWDEIGERSDVAGSYQNDKEEQGPRFPEQQLAGGSFKEFEMNLFEVLTILGSGISGEVLLARVAKGEEFVAPSNLRLVQDPEREVPPTYESGDDCDNDDGFSSSSDSDMPVKHHFPAAGGIRKSSSLATLKSPENKNPPRMLNQVLSQALSENTKRSSMDDNNSRMLKSPTVSLNSRSVPSGLSDLDDPWSSTAVVWRNKGDTLDIQASSLHHSISTLSLGLDNSGVPAAEDRRTPDRSLSGSFGIDGIAATETGEYPELVAIKAINKRKIVGMGMKQSVEREREVMALIDSAFVCGMYGAFQDREWAYLLLEPVPAGDLASLLDSRNVMFEDEAIFYVGCVLLALEHMHDRGIACMDIKPENMLLDQWGYLKVCDFGIARIFTPTGTEAGCGRWERSGTPEYMAPEVVEMHAIETGVAGLVGPDVWALGILICELLSGATPFSCDDGDPNGTMRNTKQYSRECIERSKGYATHNSSLGGFAFWGRKQQQKTSAYNSLAQHLPSETNALRGSWLRDMRSKSDSSLELIVRLLRPDPRERCSLPCSAERGGDVVRYIKNHSWFVRPEWDWDALQERGLEPPFKPEPDSLAPPFRGHVVTYDSTHEVPMTFAQFQAARDDQNYSRKSVTDIPWAGFIQVSRPSLVASEVPGMKAHAAAIIKSDSTMLFDQKTASNDKSHFPSSNWSTPCDDDDPFVF